MTIEVQGPDGSVVEFPDGTHPDIMRSALQRHFDAKAAMATPKAIEPIRQFARQATFDGSEALPAAMYAAGQAVRGKSSFGAAYGDARAAEAEQTKARSSGLNTAAGVAGGLVGTLAAPEVRALKGASVAARVGYRALAHAGQGAVIGGISGALGSSDLKSIPRNTATGAAVGSLVGGVASPAIEGAGAVRQIATRAAGNVVQAGRALIRKADPQVAQKAAVRARAAITNRVTEAGHTPDSFAVKHGDGKLVAEALGPTGHDELASIVRRPGDTARVVKDIVADRRGARDQAILDHVHRATGIDPATARAGVEGAVDAGRIAAGPYFNRVRGLDKPVWNHDLANLVKDDPHVRRALAKVVNNTRGALEPGIRLDPDTGLFSDSKSLHDAIERQPTASTWENTRQQLGREVERDAFGKPVPNSVSPFNRQIDDASHDLSGLLRKHVPGMGEAIDKAADYKSVSGAFDRAGKLKLLDEGTRPDQVQGLMARTKTDGERLAIKHGYAAELFDKSQGAQDLTSRMLRPNGVPRPGVQAKLSTVFGKDASDSIIAKVKTERMARDAENRFAPGVGSHTMPATEMAREHDVQAGMHAIKAVATGNVGAAFAGAAVGGYTSHDHVGGALKGAALGFAARRGATAAEDAGMVYRDQLGRLLTMTPMELRDELAAHAATPVRPPVPAGRLPYTPALVSAATSGERQ